MHAHEHTICVHAFVYMHKCSICAHVYWVACMLMLHDNFLYMHSCSLHKQQKMSNITNEKKDLKQLTDIVH